MCGRVRKLRPVTKRFQEPVSSFRIGKKGDFCQHAFSELFLPYSRTVLFPGKGFCRFPFFLFRKLFGKQRSHEPGVVFVGLHQIVGQTFLTVACYPHFSGQHREVGFVIRQEVGLQAKGDLHTIFQVPQKDVRLAEMVMILLSQDIFFAKGFHSPQGISNTQAFIPPAQQQLIGLNCELHFPDATEPQLDISFRVFSLETFIDLVFHGLYFFDGLKIQASPVNKGFDHFEEFFAQVFTAC